MKRYLLPVIILMSMSGFAAAAPQQPPAADSPIALIRSLYKLHNTGRGPLLDKKGRKYLVRYFDQTLADLLWKNIAEVPQDIVGNLDFDPFYNTQDPSITRFRVGEPKREADGSASVVVSFRNAGRAERITYRLRETEAGWRIQNLIYADGSDLVKILSAPL